MIVTIVKVEGLSELAEALEELPKATGANVLRRTLLEAGEPVADQAQSLAPRKTGALQVSVSVQPASPSKMTRTGKAAYDKQNKVEVVIEAGPNPQSITQEFGTVHHAAHPFMRPAWSAQKMATLERIREKLAEEIEKARARLARKAARLAGK